MAKKRKKKKKQKGEAQSMNKERPDSDFFKRNLALYFTVPVNVSKNEEASVLAVCSSCHTESVHKCEKTINQRDVYICCNCNSETFRCPNCERMAVYREEVNDGDEPYWCCTCCALFSDELYLKF